MCEDTNFSYLMFPYKKRSERPKNQKYKRCSEEVLLEDKSLKNKFKAKPFLPAGGQFQKLYISVYRTKVFSNIDIAEPV